MREWNDYDHHLDSGCRFPAARRAGTLDQTIIDEWEAVPVPPAPRLHPVVMDPESGALLILDMETTICNNPRCLATLPKMNALLTMARGKGMPVVYSLTRSGNLADIAWQLAPAPGEPIVRSNVDKFYKTDLEKILRKQGAKTLLITGYAANGAVLHTATAAAFRGFQVVIPVDTMSAPLPYEEQYTAWHMIHSPGARNRVTLTKASLVRF